MADPRGNVLYIDRRDARGHGLFDPVTGGADWSFAGFAEAGWLRGIDVNDLGEIFLSDYLEEPSRSRYVGKLSGDGDMLWRRPFEMRSVRIGRDENTPWGFKADFAGGLVLGVDAQVHRYSRDGDHSTTSLEAVRRSSVVASFWTAKN